MTRPRTTWSSVASPTQPLAPAAPPWQESAATIGRSLISLVVVVESQHTAGPALKAFNSAIRRKGEEAAAAGGSEAMEAVLQIVRDAARDRAERREALINAAWSGLTDWRA